MSFLWEWTFIPVDYSRGSFIPYCSPVQADTYLGTMLRGKDWAGVSKQDKELALSESTRAIDMLRFAGAKTDWHQYNAWPRNQATTIPDDIINACAECALALVSGVNPMLEAIQAGFEVSTVVSARVAKNPAFTPAWVSAGIPSMYAWNLLLRYLDDGLGVNVARV